METNDIKEKLARLEFENPGFTSSLVFEAIRDSNYGRAPTVLAVPIFDISVVQNTLRHYGVLLGVDLTRVITVSGTPKNSQRFHFYKKVEKMQKLFDKLVSSVGRVTEPQLADIDIQLNDGTELKASQLTEVQYDQIFDAKWAAAKRDFTPINVKLTPQAEAGDAEPPQAEAGDAEPPQADGKISF